MTKKRKKIKTSKNKKGGRLYLILLSIGFTVFFIGIVVGLWVSSSGISIIASSISSNPKFASEAKALLDSVLVDTRCSYKYYSDRHFILCSREGMSLAKHGYWKSSSGLWEAKKRDKPVKFERNKKANEKNMVKDDYISYRIHPVDEKAVYLTRYLLDPQLVGPPSHVADIQSIRYGIKKSNVLKAKNRKK